MNSSSFSKFSSHINIFEWKRIICSYLYCHWRYNNQKKGNCIGGVMVSVLASSVVDRGFEPRSGQTKDYKIGICCFSTKHTALRSRSKDWLAQNQNNVTQWCDMSTRGRLSQHYKNPTQRVGLEQSRLHHHLIEN